MNKGNVFIISGPSGSGKDTILAEIFKKLPDVFFSISSITRPMRENEREGEKYNFISKEAFSKMLFNDELLEYNEYIGNYYGTPRKPVEKATSEGRDAIIEVDVNGASQIKEKLSDAVSIFVMPPSYEELERRLRGRGTEKEEVIAKRMSEAINEIKRAEEYDYILVNDKLDVAVNDAISIILSERSKLKNKKHIILEVLKNAKS